MSNPSASGEPIRIQIFGGYAVRVHGVSADLTPQQQRLLTIICGAGERGISRPRLAWLIWRTDCTSQVRQRIRQLLHRTHARIGRVVIASEGDILRLVTGGVQDDFTVFEELLASGALAEAAGLLSREPALSVQEEGSDDFHDWLAAKLLTMRTTLRARAAQRWDETSQAGLWGAARDAAEALYLHFPSNVSVAAKLIEARARTGSFSSAEAVFGEIRNRVDDPGALRDLEAQIDRVRRLREPPSLTPSPTEPVTPLVGRSSDISAALKALSTMREGCFQCVLISGEAGIGKTRVLQAVRQEALLQGFRCLLASPVEPESRIPLNVLADAFSEVDVAAHLRALGSPWREVIAALLPVVDDEPIQEVPPIQETRLSRRLLDALHMLFERIAAEEPTLVFIDNLQWADATTVSALQFIQRRWKGGPLGLVAAARTDLVHASEPASGYLSSEASTLEVRHIALTELGQEDAFQLVRHLIHDSIDDQTCASLLKLGGAHPLFLAELSREYAMGRLTLPSFPAEPVSIPLSLKEILEGRLQLLTATAMKVAGLLAVRAKSMRLSELAELTGVPVERCADSAEELKSLGLVHLERDRVWIAHELFRSALYQHLSEARRAVLHLAIASLLADSGDEIPSGEMAIHSARAGDSKTAAHHGWAAARSALENGAVSEAAYFFELVVDNESDEASRAQATAELARALHLNRAIERANPMLELASVRLRQTGDPERARRMDIRRVEGLGEAGDMPLRDLLERLQAIKAECEAASDWEALALALDAELRLRHTENDILGVQTLFLELRRIPGFGCPVASALAHSGLAIGVLLGEPQVALAAARDAARECPPDSEHRLKILLRLLLALHYQGLFFTDEGRAAVAEAQILSKRSGDLLLRFSLVNNLAVAHLDTGDLGSAEVYTEQSARLLGRADLDLNRFNQANNAGELALAQQDYGRAYTLFTEAEGFVGPKTPVFATDLVNAGLGLAALGKGDLKSAKLCEERLSSEPKRWHYDPTTIIALKSFMLKSRGKRREAAEVLQRAALDLEGRLELAWLKIRLLQVQLSMGSDRHEAETMALEGLRRAKSLGLQYRVREFSSLLSQL